MTRLVLRTRSVTTPDSFKLRMSELDSEAYSMASAQAIINWGLARNARVPLQQANGEICWIDPVLFFPENPRQGGGAISLMWEE